jgi:carboxypeptidase family protein/ankyrin repeat protein
MSAKDSLKRLTVKSPCFRDWTSMTGNDQVRFCEHCKFEVHNISEMTRTEALRLIATSQGRLCVRYYRDPHGSVVTQPTHAKLHGIGRRVSRLAAGAFSATLSLSAAVADGSAKMSTEISQNAQDNGRFALGATVVGTITDQNGAVIPGATISIFNSDRSVAMYTSTSDEGIFRFDGLASGTYSLHIQAPGFAGTDAGIFLSVDGEVRVDRTLEVAGLTAEMEIGATHTEQFATMGVIAFVAPEDPFIKAAQEDNIETVERLIAESDVNLRDQQSGTTALEHAVQNGNRELTQLLLSRGAEVNAQNSSGQTVLMMLDEDATSDLIWDLVNAGAKVNAADQGGNTALINAASRNNVEAVKTLLEAGAKVETKNKEGQTALMGAASSGLINNVRALILAGAALNELDNEGKNALRYAVENEHRVVIRFLRSQGAVESVAQVSEDDDNE